MHNMKHLWQLDPQVIFLNHGSYGACPLAIIQHQHSLRLLMEREPVRFFQHDYFDHLATARQALATFVGAPAEQLVFVTNATSGINTVLKSLKFSPSDEILITNHGYLSCKNTAHHVASRAKCQVVEADIPFPLTSDDQVLQAIEAKLTKHTKLALIDHITSPTGLILPLKKIIQLMKAKNIDILVDGAHAPGMIELDITDLDPTYYVGNCHKWLCAPKGSAFLYLNENHKAIKPLITSYAPAIQLYQDNALHNYFDWQGTYDPTPILSIPFAITYGSKLLAGGWPDIFKRNHAILRQAKTLICEKFNLKPSAERYLGTLFSFVLPPQFIVKPFTGFINPLQEQIFNDYQIELPIMRWNNQWLMRISAHLYNQPDDYQKLITALDRLRAT